MLNEAEKMGACCWIVDPLTLIWNELLDSFQQKLGYIPIDKWQEVRQLWNGDYIRYFLNCGMNCLALDVWATISRSAKRSSRTARRRPSW